MSQEQEQKPAITVDSVLASEDGYDGFVRALFNRVGNPAVDFTHAALGIVTECHELLTAKSEVNALEELGDLEFYEHALLQVLADHYGEDELAESCTAISTNTAEMQQIVPDAHLKALPVLHAEMSTVLLDVAKRWVGYGKAPTMRPGTLVALAMSVKGIAALMSAGRTMMQDEDRITRVNVAKLLDRYKGVKFNADHAINRDVASEARVMEDAQNPA
jgi:hypothetical protein